MEPIQAFPYKPPTLEIVTKYAHIFELNKPLPSRIYKQCLDKIISILFLFISLPILLILKVAYLVEGVLIPENKGPLLYFYNAVSAGKIIRKYKIRVIKTKYIDHHAAKRNDWIAYSAEWIPESKTHLGNFVKNYYLDELPQFWSVFKGDMTIVGPRPLSVMHYERDRLQGNVSRLLLRGGMLGLGHINKGTSEMGNPVYEYEYVDQYIKRSSFSLMCLDIWIIWKGFLLILKGGGH